MAASMASRASRSRLAMSGDLTIESFGEVRAGCLQSRPPGAHARR